MAVIETTPAPRTPSAPKQVLRGLVFTGAGLVALGVASALLKTPGANEGLLNNDLDGHTTFSIHPQWKAIAVVGFVVVSASFMLRRIRRWSERPRWLLPLSVVGLIATASLMFWPTTAGNAYDDTHTCVAVLDAWHTVVANPGPADLAVLRDGFSPGLLQHSPFPDPSASKAFYDMQRNVSLAADAQLSANPAYQRAYRYEGWQSSQGVCAPHARPLLIGAGVLYVGGAALLAGATVIARKRRAI